MTKNDQFHQFLHFWELTYGRIRVQRFETGRVQPVLLSFMPAPFSMLVRPDYLEGVCKCLMLQNNSYNTDFPIKKRDTWWQLLTEENGI